MLFILAWAGILLLAVFGISRLPGAWQESSRLSELSSRLNNSKDLENRMNRFLENIKTQAAGIMTEISKRQSKIEATTFSRLNADEISVFIDDLPKLFADAGVTVINLGYRARETIEQFIDLPFDAQIQCDYTSMRHLLHALEKHSAGIRIEQLEFVNLDDDQHRTRLRLQCKVRFKTVE
ncbi:MAG: hypothetical protein KKB51_22690 [Candidatus Riflebacteria bacterium]|nr:hypothetical protein [Candidatus Riflebacteria bacterium]